MASQQPVYLQYQPKYFVIQTANRLKTKPKILEYEVPVIDPTLFRQESNYLLYKMETAFNELRNDESRIKSVEYVKVEDDVLEAIEKGISYTKHLRVVIEDLGNYEFKVSEKDQKIYVQSPIEGIIKYYYETKNERWVSNKDHHLMDELIIREITKHCKGLLKI